MRWGPEGLPSSKCGTRVAAIGRQGIHHGFGDPEEVTVGYTAGALEHHLVTGRPGQGELAGDETTRG
jgi:hypothetical protein